MSYSVALCTYNGALFIEEQLQSIFNQTVLPTEMVVCDDVSSDNTLELVRAFAKENDQVSWVIISNEQNLGYVKNFEKAIGLCQQEIIFLCDQDDIWMPIKAERHLEEYKNNKKVALLFSNAKLLQMEPLVDRERLIKPDKVQDLLRSINNEILMNSVVTGATVSFRKDLVCQALPFPDFSRFENVFIHDGWLGAVAAVHNSVKFLDEELIFYRIHAGQNVGVGGVQKEIKGIEFLMYIVRKSYNRNLCLKEQYVGWRRGIVEIRLKLMKNLLSESNNSFIRLLKCNPFLYVFQVNEFTTLRMYFGNLLLFIRRKQVYEKR